MEKYKYKVQQFTNAVNDFKISLNIDTGQFEPPVTDTLKSGQVQKFEICAELMWKAVKAHLLDINGIECKSPKQAIKEFYNLSYISVEDFEAELGILDDRNSLSHIYNKEQFNEIYEKVRISLSVFQRAADKLQTGFD